jgi:hypothetical protein
MTGALREMSTDHVLEMCACVYENEILSMMEIIALLTNMNSYICINQYNV